MESENQPEQVGRTQSPSLKVSSSSSISQASTVVYEHEPFETFQHKVMDVVAKHFHCDLSRIKVTHLKGGSYNRVVAVSIAHRPKKPGLSWFIAPIARCLGPRHTTQSLGVDSYIVRIPRGTGTEEDFHVDFEVAGLQVADAHVALPTPEVVSYDITCNNAIGKPYMIQKRIPGQNLSLILEELNSDQKKCIAKRVTELASTIAAVEGPAGLISAATLSSPPGPLAVEKFRVPSFGAQKHGSVICPTQVQKPVEFLLEFCERWREYHRSEHEDAAFHALWDAFAAISKSLDKRGFLEGPCVLVHGDLKPYNILGEVFSETEVEITGIIDWDSAVLAPEFMAYRAPFWLWVSQEKDINSCVEDEESMANLSPSKEDGKMMKQIFIDNASEKYKLHAFAPESMLARRMFVVLQHGIFGPWYYKEAEDVIDEWNELHPEDGVQPLEKFELDDCSGMEGS